MLAANFHFALVGHLLKGFRHPTPTTVSRTTRILTMLLGIVAKPTKKDKFEVSKESVAYLAGMFHHPAAVPLILDLECDVTCLTSLSPYFRSIGFSFGRGSQQVSRSSSSLT